MSWDFFLSVGVFTLTTSLLCGGCSILPQRRQILQAHVAVNLPEFTEGATTNLLLTFELKNNGKRAVDPKIELSQLFVNGKELKDSGRDLASGPTNTRRELSPGETVRFVKGMGERFKEPGTYEIVWKGNCFGAPAITFLIEPKKK